MKRVYKSGAHKTKENRQKNEDATKSQNQLESWLSESAPSTTDSCKTDNIATQGNNMKLNYVNNVPICIWDKEVPNTEQEKFRRLIEKKYNQNFDTHWEFHRWTCDNFADYWKEVWNYIGVIHSKSYDEVYRKTGEGFLDCEWFSGARFNYAENILRIRDNRVALIYSDEEGNEEIITYSEMYEAVKLYAAAFRKHGLKSGDRVACYMSNRKEPFFAALAAISIGASFGGPQPYFGAKPATDIIKRMEPKFLISIDHHLEGHVYSNIDNLPEIVDNTPSLEKVIIIPSYPETKTRDLSNIRNSCLLEDFLNSGRNPDGSVPEIKFEQLPFDHPLCINFTSGTTGLPKAIVHSAGTFICNLASNLFSWNMQPGDVIYHCYAVGWSLWDAFVPCLARGVTLFLLTGTPTGNRPGTNLWDIFAKYKISYGFLVTSIVDKLEKMNAVPGPTSNLEHLRFLHVGGCPVKLKNCQYLLNKVKKDMFVCSLYGASEIFGNISGNDLNSPSYAGEIQAPGLGTDVRCFDSEGKSVVNKRGEMVIVTPSPAFPLYIRKDEGNELINETYLSQYPGVWCHNDEIWINPLTNGITVVGRSDDTLVQYGDRFGSGDIYNAIQEIQEIEDSICVSQTKQNGDCRAVLFIKMKEGHSFTPYFKEKVAGRISDVFWYEYVPQVILDVKDIPYNQNNKKMESIVRKILATNQVPELHNAKNGDCLKYYCNIPELISYNS